ncbi:MAG TPA: zf-HC2 domain-containing protein [Blastocatellia bacterium]|nr:zf-HC2 domain-containing protein [Blastocatellia bacterium]
MNVISFEQKACERIRQYLDAWLSGELPVKTSLEVHRHLDRCRSCAKALGTRRRVKDALKRAVEREPVPEALRDKILNGIRLAAGRNHWLPVLTAAIALLAGAGVRGAC